MSEEAPVREAVLVFETFRLDRRDGLSRLLKSGRWQPISLGSRALALLRTIVAGRGELVTKQALMDAAWPGMAVEDSNLTVQMSALRRVLDEGRSEGSCIQTVVGRGYRFLSMVTERRAAAPDVAITPFRPVRMSQAPRLSVVVLPFRHLSNAPDGDHLADAITGGLTTDLFCQLPGAVVITHQSAGFHGDRELDPCRVGVELGVRYAVQGGLRMLDGIARVNVQLISTETGAQVWSDRFNRSLTDRASAEDAIVRRIATGLCNALVHDESARVLRERPESPDALDLALRARSLMVQPASLHRFDEARLLFDEALQLDPRCVPALTGLAQVLTAGFLDRGYWLSGDEPPRLARLIKDAQAIAPSDETVLARTAAWFEIHGRYPEAMAISRRIIETWPNNTYGYAFLARSKIFCGEPGEAIPLLEKAIETDPYNFSIFDRYWRLGYAYLLLRREREALPWFHRAVAAYPDAPPVIQGANYARFAAAYALIGELDDARRALEESLRNWPFRTLRRLGHENYRSSIYAAQYGHLRHGLRLAGLRDHANEYADFEVASTDNLSAPLVGYTPMTTPGASTIATPALETFLLRDKPLVIDTLAHFWGRSLPGAVGLSGAGIGGSFTDGAQDRLRSKMLDLTDRDQTVPIVAVGFNSEAFDGRNLALRLLALGHTNVYWYRGGREAWEVSGQPLAELAPLPW